MKLSDLKLPRDLIQRNGVKILGYGKAGTGKTRSAITAPRPIIISIEQGLLSLINDNIPVFSVYHNITPNMNPEERNSRILANIVEFFEWLEKSNEAKNFDMVYVDSISEITTFVLLDEEKRHKDNRQAYKAMADRVLKWIRMLNALPNKHVMLIAKEEVGSNNELPYHQPAFEGRKLFTETTHMFDEIFRFQTQRFKVNNQFQDFMVCATRNTSSYLARDKTGKLEEFIPQNIGQAINILMS